MRILTSLSAVDAGGIAVPSDIRPERLPEIGAFLKNAYYMEQTGGHELDEFDTEDYTASGKFIFASMHMPFTDCISPPGTLTTK